MNSNCFILLFIQFFFFSCINKSSKNDHQYVDHINDKEEEIADAKVKIAPLKSPDTVRRGDTATYHFVVENIGTQDYIVESLNVDCSCLKPAYKEIVAVGDIDTISLSFRTKNYLGDFKKYAVLKGNSKQRFHKLILKGYIVE